MALCSSKGGHLIFTICNIYSYSNRYHCLLPHFIEYYTRLESDKIIFICNAEVASDLLNSKIDKRRVLIEPPKTGALTKLEGIVGGDDSERINRVKNENVVWYVPTDLDEFHDISPFRSFQELRTACIKGGHKYVASQMLDMVAPNRALPKTIAPEIPISDQFPVELNITGEIMKAWTRKVVFASPEVDVDKGHHYTKNFKYDSFPQIFTTRHYKWFGDILKYERNKMIERKKLGWDFYVEQERLLNNNTFIIIK